MRFISFIIILFSVVSLSAQDFLFQAQLPSVDSEGYYHIFLPPVITSKLNSKFSDIRIFDKHNREVPYLRLLNDEIFKTSQADELDIIENDYKRIKKFSLITLDNHKKKQINNLVFIVDNVKNAEAWVNISASNDQKIWTVLKNNVRYMPEYSDSAFSEIRITDLPETDFEFFKIIIFDYNKTIFNVLKIWNYNFVSKSINFVELNTPKITQDDTSESNKTVLQLDFSEPQYIDKLHFEVSYPSTYLRKAEIVKRDSFTGRRVLLQLFDQNQKDFFLNSDSTNNIRLSRLNAKTLYLIVYNNDDISLKFSKVVAYQQKEYIVAYLKPSQSYSIRFGNSNLPSPVYDLKYFKNKIPENCEVLTPLSITTYKTDHKSAKVLKVAKTALWITFLLVVIVLSLISLKLFVFSRKQKKNNDDLMSL